MAQSDFLGKAQMGKIVLEALSRRTLASKIDLRKAVALNALEGLRGRRAARA